MCKLERSWLPFLHSPANCKLTESCPSANDMLAPFNHNLSEYGFVLQNFWNNANQHVVPDPFGIVR
ncbi:MAG: isochorismatase family protein [Steroidobacteraceae bacterium]|nr:isochorismatase family protein [Steroidobacteraceae bacterium]